jgi:uncharacterized protein YndB with AHSA1/START domain
MSSLMVERNVASPPERIWSAFTTDALATWFWPARWETECSIDLRVGGDYRLSSDVAGIALSGEFVVIEPDQLLVQSWQWDGDTEVTRVAIRIQTVPDGATVTVSHDGFGSESDRDSHIQGWNDCLDRLPEAVA